MGPGRLEELRLEYAARFRQICREMEADDFAKLVDEMASFRLKYEELEARIATQPSLDASDSLPRG